MQRIGPEPKAPSGRKRERESHPNPAVYDVGVCATSKGEKGIFINVYFGDSGPNGFEMLCERLRSLKPLIESIPHRISIRAYSSHFGPLDGRVPTDDFVTCAHNESLISLVDQAVALAPRVEDFRFPESLGQTDALRHQIIPFASTSGVPLVASLSPQVEHLFGSLCPTPALSQAEHNAPGRRKGAIKRVLRTCLGLVLP